MQKRKFVLSHLRESKLIILQYFITSFLSWHFSLLLDNIGRIESSNRMSDDSDSDLYSDLSDTDDDLDGNLTTLYMSRYC